MKIHATLLLFVVLLSPGPAAAETADLDAANREPTPIQPEERVFIVNEYRYEPGTSGGDADMGQSLCGSRCNSLSIDYLNYLTPPGWRMIRVAEQREVKLDLNNPFMGGECICIADEYVIRKNELYMVKEKTFPIQNMDAKE